MDDAQIERLKFHLETGDYFRLISTVFGFIEETVVDGCQAIPDELMELQAETVKRFRKDLAYLYDHYQILPKSSE